MLYELRPCIQLVHYTVHFGIKTHGMDNFKKHVFRKTFSLSLRLVSMKLQRYADGSAVRQKFRGIVVERDLSSFY